MNNTEHTQTLKALKENFNENGYEAVLVEDELSSLKILIDKLGEKELGAAILEINFVEEPAFEQVPDLNVAQFFATFDMKVSMEQLPKILVGLNQLNLTSALGSFQIFDEECQLYFKYNGLVKGVEHNQMMESMIPVINWMIPMMEDCYDSLKAFVAGEY